MSEVKCSTCKGDKTLTFEQGQRRIPCVTCSGSGIDWRKSYDAAQSQLAALREELATSKRNEHNSEVAYKAAIEKQDELRDRKNSIVDLQQRLADAERQNAVMADLLREVQKAARKQAWAHGYPTLFESIDAALNPKPEAASHERASSRSP